MIPDPFNPDPPGVDALVEGYFLHKMPAGRLDVPVRIWFGPPLDPETREEMDRAPRWQVHINGVEYGDEEFPPTIAGSPVESLERIWPFCAAYPIDEEEYRYRVDRAEYADDFDHNDAFARTGGRIDPRTVTLPFS